MQLLQVCPLHRVDNRFQSQDHEESVLTFGGPSSNTCKPRTRRVLNRKPGEGLLLDRTGGGDRRAGRADRDRASNFLGVSDDAAARAGQQAAITTFKECQVFKALDECCCFRFQLPQSTISRLEPTMRQSALVQVLLLGLADKPQPVSRASQPAEQWGFAAPPKQRNFQY